MMRTPHSLVVVGGGLSGYTLAKALRAHDFTGRITVIEQEPALYDRPPLSKAAIISDALLADLQFTTPEQLAAMGVDVVCGRRVVALENGAVLDDGTVVRGDAVVLATGGRPRVLPFRGNDAPVVHTLRTFSDTQRIKAAARPGGRILVVGAGLIGAELTSSLCALGVHVTLIDPVEVPLIPAAGESVARRLHEMHGEHGVDVRVGSILEIVDRDGEYTAVLDDGSRFPVDAVVVGAGIVPNTELAESAGLTVDGGVVVDERHYAGSGVYAIGDVARVRGSDGELRRREEHWEAAQHDAEELAVILVGDDPAPRSAPWWWSDRYHVHVEGVGRMTGSGLTIVRSPHVAFHLDDGLLVGAVSIDDSQTVRAARRMIDQRIPVAAADLADPSVSLRDLLRGSRSLSVG
jgi:NADPH-dependent 2,4-dienoyl-CoA reductase/sulfur reductase-like enzyme